MCKDIGKQLVENFPGKDFKVSEKSVRDVIPIAKYYIRASFGR